MAKSLDLLTEDIYNYIPPPIPLIPKNMYVDDTPLSHQPLILGQIFPHVDASQAKIGPDLDMPPASPPTQTLLSIIDLKLVVYRRDPKSTTTKQELLNLSKFFRLEKPKGNKEVIKDYYTPKENDTTLVFESRFESGNLWLASKVTDFEYNLILQNDINTKGNTQWFYFRVSNTPKNIPVKFNIVNFCKSGSLYNSGMKILKYSTSKAEFHYNSKAKSINTNSNENHKINHQAVNNENYTQKRQTGWERVGEDIKYYPNGVKKGKNGKSYYTLSFTYTFLEDEDVVFFAYSCPYTYSEMMKYLQNLEEVGEKGNILKRRLLTYTIAGNRCDCLTIVAPGTPEEIKRRRGVVISSRVHPGETVSSWMMHGVLDFLVSDEPEAVVLRENFIFKIIPMLNPDGVINGNYRCNLAGVDLNRQWKEPVKHLHPTIFAAKKMIKAFSRERKVELICDLHGHSRRKNIFMYGCDDSDHPESTRTFPYILSKVSSFFSYKNCSFRMQKSKESTLRIAIFNETKVLSTYTLESSFCGCDFGSNSGLHLTTEDLKLMGKQLCLAIMINNNLNPTNSLQKSIQKLEILEEIKENKDILTSSNDDCSSGSDSDPSEDNLDEPEYVKLMQNPLPKKRVSSDAGARKKNAFKKEKLGLQIHLKNSRQGEKPMKMIQKCFNCGEAKDVNHVCAKKITMNKTMVHNYTLQESKGGNIRVSLTKRNYNSLSKSSNVFPVYTRADGKKVRDQATQTTATITSRKPDSNRASLYFLSVNSSPVSANNSHKKSDVLENLVDLEKLRNIFRNDKNILPSLSPVKNTNEKFTKTL